jgi:hypothetical protein
MSINLFETLIVSVTKTKTRLFFGLWAWLVVLIYPNEVLLDKCMMLTGRQSALWMIISGWALASLVMASFVTSLSTVLYNIGKIVYSEWKDRRSCGKALVFIFWQVCLVAYYVTRFTLTFYTGKGLNLFYFLYYCLLMSMTFLIGFCSAMLKIVYLLEGDNDGHDNLNNPVDYDQDSRIFSIQCENGLFVSSIDSLVPIPPKSNISNARQIYIYLSEPESPFIRQHPLTFDSAEDALLARKSIFRLFDLEVET